MRRQFIAGGPEARREPGSFRGSRELQSHEEETSRGCDKTFSFMFVLPKCCWLRFCYGPQKDGPCSIGGDWVGFSEFIVTWDFRTSLGLCWVFGHYSRESWSPKKGGIPQNCLKLSQYCEETAILNKCFTPMSVSRLRQCFFSCFVLERI